MAKELKNEIKYGIQLKDEQKAVKAGAFEKDVTIVLGSYGSGKTACATVIALDLLFKKHVNKIFITRPIDFKSTGFLPGNIKEKLYFHTFPMMQNFYTAYKKELIDKLVEEGKIEIVPIDYLKGYTIADAIMLIDEFEDITFSEFELILSRLGKGSKMIFTGSVEQTGIKNSCIKDVMMLKDCPQVNFHTLKEMHRNESIIPILEFIKNAKTNTIQANINTEEK